MRRATSTRQHGASSPRRPAKRPPRPIIVRSARSYWWYFFLVALPILAVGAGGAVVWVQQDTLPWLDQIRVAAFGSETDRARLTPTMSFRNASGPINQPLELGIALNNGTGAEILVLSGISPGTSLSAGASLSATRWSLPGPVVENAFISPPADFRGTMPVTATLYSSAHDILETREIRFEWGVAEAESGAPGTDLTGGVSGSAPATDADGTQQGRLSGAFGSVAGGHDVPPAPAENSETPAQAPAPTWLTMVEDWLSQMSSISPPQVDQPFAPTLAPKSSPAPAPAPRTERTKSLNRARPGAEEPRREQVVR